MVKLARITSSTETETSISGYAHDSSAALFIYLKKQLLEGPVGFVCRTRIGHSIFEYEVGKLAPQGHEP